jgi:hypothetical protein
MDQMEIIYWIWSKKGEHLEQSPKKLSPTQPKVPPEQDLQKGSFLTPSLEENMVQDSKGMFAEENNRELSSERLAKRALVSDQQLNPYLSSNDYLNDLTIRDSYLRPKNSNFNVKNKDLNDK